MNLSHFDSCETVFRFIINISDGKISFMSLRNPPSCDLDVLAFSVLCWHNEMQIPVDLTGKEERISCLDAAKL